MKGLYGVIGDPIAHSMSPDMHNDAFGAMGIDAHYHAFHVKPGDLGTAVKGMRALGVKGFNVTVPHKTAIMPFLDKIDPLAATIGAVNTVILEDGGYTGYNTDGLGFVSGLISGLDGPLKDHRALIIGAGGAARAIYYTLISEGLISIDVCNRTKERAEALISGNPNGASSKALSLPEAEDGLSRYSLIINTTSIGMEPKTEEMPIDLANLQADAFVSDIIYNPLETRLLREAKGKGARIQNGLPMFVGQGALAFKIWTGKIPDLERMKKIVLDKLGG